MPPEVKDFTPKGRRAYQAIVDTAINQFRTRGYTETTIQDICLGVGIGTGTFYHYFRSKADVIMAYVGSEEEELLEFYRRLDKTSYMDAILAVSDHYLDMYLFKGAGLIAQVYSMMVLSEISVGKLKEERFYRILEDAFRGGQENGEFSRDCAPAVYADIFIAQWFFVTSLWCNDPASIDLRSTAREHFKAFMCLVSIPPG